MNSTKHFLVSGGVQGVGYRMATQSKAQSLGLTGWVKNLNTGQVELVAQGDPSVLSELEVWLWLGPRYAKVDSVVVGIYEPAVFTPKFEIRY